MYLDESEPYEPGDFVGKCGANLKVLHEAVESSVAGGRKITLLPY